MVVRAHRVLGISLGTQKVGFAVIEHNELLLKKVSSFNYKWSEQKLVVITSAINTVRWRNDVTAISIKIPHTSHHTAGFKALLKDIKHYYHSLQIPVHVCTIKELKAHGIDEKRKNKKQLVYDMAQKYPDLLPQAHKELASRITYYTKMFEAVAAAELFLEQLQTS